MDRESVLNLELLQEALKSRLQAALVGWNSMMLLCTSDRSEKVYAFSPLSY